MHSSEEYMLVVDFPAIKRFVFGTERLVQIRGASGILDQFNRVTLPKLLHEKLGKDTVECVYAGGGAGQFIIRAPRKSIEEALTFIAAQCRAESGGGLPMITVLVEYGENYKEATRRAYQELRRRKEESPPWPRRESHVGLFRDCDSCSGTAAERVKHGETVHWLCPVCAAKTHFGQQAARGLWADFAQALEKRGYDRHAILKARPDDFEDVGKACGPKPGHVALIYADGNAMGRLVQEIDSPETFRFFSQTVDTAIREACYEALVRHCLPSSQVPTLIPALILMLGGDDLLVYTTADVALPVAMDAARLFEEKTRAAFSTEAFFQKKLSGQGLTISLGVAFGRSNTPFSMLLNQAEELLKSAKLKGSLDERSSKGYTPSYIDYHFAAQYNHVRALDCRKEQQVLKVQRPGGASHALYLTSRPYALEDMKKLWNQAKAIAGLGIPRSRLKRFAMAPSRGWVNANLEFYTLLSRIKEKENDPTCYRKYIMWKTLESFGCRLGQAPWIQEGQDWRTVLTDLIELCELMPKNKGADHAPPAH